MLTRLTYCRSRRDGRSNGTLTFRRSSTTPFNQSASHTPNDVPQTPSADTSGTTGVPQTPSYDAVGAQRYSKDEILDLFRSVPTPNLPDIANLLVPGWNPGQINGATTRSWGKTGDSNHVAPDPGVCWDQDGKMQPVGLVEMTEEEKTLFTTDVNSPVKIPQPQNKDGNQNATVPNGRKASISQGTGGFGVGASPSTASRPGTRRRETTDANPFQSSGLASPSTSRLQDSSWFGRRTAEQPKDVSIADENEDDDQETRATPAKANPFPGLIRNNTFDAAASLWGAKPAPASAATAFGNFALASPATSEKRIGLGRGESRLAHLIPKDSIESLDSKSGDNAIGNASRAWRPRPRTDTDPFGADEGASVSGSAALGGAHDDSPPPIPSQRGGAGGLSDTPVKGNTGDFGMSGLNLSGGNGSHGPASPSDTNPYRSPAAERGGEDHDENGRERIHPFGQASEQQQQQPPHSNFSTIQRAFGGGPFVEGSDRSQTSSVAGNRYPTVNTLTGWPAGPTTGTPDRERAGFASAFGGTLFSPVGDVHPPSLGGLGGGGMFGSGPGASNVGATGSLRGSKLGALFPAALQAQMQSHEHDPLGDSIPDLRQSNPLGAIGRGPPGSQAQVESPMRTGRGVFEDLFPSTNDAARLAFSTADQGQPGLTSTASGAFTPTSGIAPPFPTSSQSSADLTAAQNRQMVMPDRMRWVYLDPQGQVQGPFNGLEMNDWYKAQFFSADLRVKKIEDVDFEPLGQLIRRIGNSREPFLVPQIGIPHGPPSQTGPFSPGDRGVIPPLMGAFPSFGRTLTAEEQNNLERRKQEEQILMARQREYLAHQQAFSKIQMPGASGSLHHHSSAHSLQSQPSFGSISSPLGLPPQAPIGGLGPNSGFFDTPGSLLQQAPGSGLGNGSDLFPPDLTAQERQMLASLGQSTSLSSAFPSGQATQPIGAPIGDNGLRSQLPGVDQLQQDSQGFSARLREFNDIRSQRDAEESSKGPVLPNVAEEKADQHETDGNSSQAAVQQAVDAMREVARASQGQGSRRAGNSQLSLTEQVQKTQAAQAAVAAAANAVAAAAVKQAEDDEAWAKSHHASGMPLPFPPPSSTPLPAPTAQRQRSTLPTQFTGPSPTGTPDTLAEVAPPPLAPWAQHTEASHKGPSLKEIQEAEAKKAAKLEEAAAAQRRAQAEQEAALLREREKAAAIATGLPSSSTWGTVSPANTPGASVSSPWSKPAAGAVAAVTAAVTPGAERKKTLAEIQREEEARKQKAKELAAQQQGVAAQALGKRYADLASKTSVPPGLPAHAVVGVAAGVAPVSAAGWATVGAGGKVKAPPGPSSALRTPVPTTVKPTPTPVVKAVAKPSATAASKDSGSDAQQEFRKWIHRELSRGLSSGLDSTFKPPPLVSAVFV